MSTSDEICSTMTLIMSVRSGLICQVFSPVVESHQEGGWISSSYFMKNFAG